MAHYQQLKFVKTVSTHLNDFFSGKKILEVGSWAVNGSVRDFFSNCEYIGADISEGPCVDLVCAGQDLTFPDNEFDVVISAECFEHNPYWIQTFRNMVRMLKPGGLCVITCASVGRKEHGTRRASPDSSLTALSGHRDYYRNLSKKDLRRNFHLSDIFDSHKIFYNVYGRDLYFLGIKKGGGARPYFSDDLIAAVNTIKTRSRSSIKNKIRKNFSFWINYGWARLLGEERYHDIRHAVKSGAWKTR